MLQDALDLLGVVVTIRGTIDQIINREKDDEKREKFKILSDKALETGDLSDLRNQLWD